MSRLIAFGDSFVWGSELSDCTNHLGSTPSPSKHYSRSTWPALLAKHLNLDYIPLARPGAGNNEMCRRVLQFADLINPDDVVVIAWSFMERWEYYTEYKNLPLEYKYNQFWYGDDDNSWNPLHIHRNGFYKDKEVMEVYLKYIQSDNWSKYNSLQQMFIAQTLLESKGCRYIITSMSDDLMDQTNSPAYAHTLQTRLVDKITSFEGRNFVDWAKEKGHPIGSYGHPLEAAHQAAADLIIKSKFSISKV